METHDNQSGNSQEPLMKPLEELEQRAYGGSDISQTAENDPAGMPVLNRPLPPFPGQPYPLGIAQDPTADEDNSAVARGTSESEREGERRSGE